MKSEDEQIGAVQPTAKNGLKSNRDFQLLWVGSSISALGSRVSSIAYPLLVLALTGSPADAGLVGFSATISYVLFQLPAGVLVDRCDRKLLMIFCDVGRALAVGSIALAGYLERLTLLHLLAASFIEGVLTVVNGLCEPVAIQQIVPPHQRLPALSKLEARGRLATLLGQPLGGLTFGLGRWIPFLIDLLSYIVSLITVLLISQKLKPEPTNERKGIVDEMVVAVRWLWKQRLLRDMILLISFSNLLFQVLVLVLLVEAKNQAASSMATGLMIAGSGLGGILGSLAAPWVRQRTSLALMTIGATWVWALLMPLVAVVHNLYALGCIFGLMAFAGANWNVAIGTFRLEITPAQMLGRVGSAMGLVAAGALPLGSLLGGYLLERWGLQVTVLWLIGAMLLLACIATRSLVLRRGTA